MTKRIISILLLLSISLSTFVGCDMIIEGVKNHFPIDDFGNMFENNAEKAFYDVIPDAVGFEKLDLSEYKIHSSIITEIQREKSGLGYAVKLNTVGYCTNLVIVVGVSCDGVVTGVSVISHEETTDAVDSYGENFIGKNLDGAKNVDLVANSTMTTKAYRRAVVDAVKTVMTICGIEDNVDYGNEVGNRCPSHDLPVLNSDSTVNINDFRGKKVIINFWGTWCTPCKSEMPDFDRIADEYADDVVVIAIHSVSGKENAPEYIANNFSDSNIIFTCDLPLSSTGDVYFTMLGGSGLYPRTIILDENGVITFIQDGMLNYEQIVNEIS